MSHVTPSHVDLGLHVKGLVLIKRFKDFIAGDVIRVPTITHITITTDGVVYKQINEGKLIDGRFKQNIRLDQATHLHGAAQPHAHIYGRKGNEIVAVNLDGTASHGKKGRLHADDAAALTAHGYKIPPDGIVEWWHCEELKTVLFE